MSDPTESHRKTGWRFTAIELALLVGALVLIISFLSFELVRARDAARLSQSRNNLRQLGLALYNYHDSMTVLPPGGVFNASGVPYHCWTTSIDPYLASSPWFFRVNFSVPWDDPTQVDDFMGQNRFTVLYNPRVIVPPRKDELFEAAYAGNSWILNRNSSVSLQELDSLQNTIFVGEAGGHYLPLGCPGNWRDVDAGLNRSDDSFGLRDGAVTLVVLADGHARALGPDTDPAVWNALAGPAELKPTADRTRRPPFPYELPKVPIWRNRSVIARKATVFSLRLDPSGTKLYVHFMDHEIDHHSKQPEHRDCSYWMRDLGRYGTIQHVEVRGHLKAVELNPFTELKHLKRLTLSTAEIEGDLSAFRSRLSSAITVD